VIGLRRVRAYATIIAACLWAVWIVDMATPGAIDRLGKIKGTDFIHFYVIGSIAHEGRWDQLFDASAQYERAQRIVPGSRDTVYVPIESPQTALFFAPLTRYSYGGAFAFWVAITLLLYWCCCRSLWHACPALQRHQPAVIAVCAAFPGLYSTVLHGQTSIFGLCAITGGLLLLRGGRRFAAGLAIGCLAFKPHWLAAATLIFFVAREWRVMAGACVGAAGQVAVATLTTGVATMRTYAVVLRALPRIADLLEPKPGDSLRGFFQSFVPVDLLATVLFVATSLATVAIAAKIWRSRAPFEIRGASIVFALVLISPHVNAYDLIVLLPGYFLLANWLEDASEDKQSASMAALLCGLFFVPLLAGVPAVARLAFSVPAMAALLGLLARLAARVAETRSPALAESAYVQRCSIS